MLGTAFQSLSRARWMFMWFLPQKKGVNLLLLVCCHDRTTVL